jgi:holin-like protein
MTVRRIAEMTVAFGVLVGLDALGGIAARAAHLPVPGTVLGLLALFVGLILLGRVPAPLEELARLLFDHLNLLYIPAAVGVMAYGALVRRDAWPITAALVVSGVIGLVVVGWTFQIVDRRGRGGYESGGADGR